MGITCGLLHGTDSGTVGAFASRFFAIYEEPLLEKGR